MYALSLDVVWLYSLTLHTWIRGYLRRADQNQDGKMSYDEVKRLLQMINIDLSEHYARALFKVRVMCLASVQHQYSIKLISAGFWKPIQ